MRAEPESPADPCIRAESVQECIRRIQEQPGDVGEASEGTSGLNPVKGSTTRKDFIRKCCPLQKEWTLV